MSNYLTEKWAPVLSHQDLPEIKDPYRKAVTAQLLENQEKFLREQAVVEGSASGLLTEAPTMSVNAQGYQGITGGSVNADGLNADAGPRAGFDPVLISLIRRSMPNLIAYDICGVQPMSGPTGMIFAMRAMYDGPDGPNEAFFDEADPTFSNGADKFKAGSQAYNGYEQDANGQFSRPLATGGQTGAGDGWNSPFDGPFGGTTEAAASGLSPDGPYAADKQINHPYVPGEAPAERNPGLLDSTLSGAGVVTDPSNPGGNNYDPTLQQMRGMKKDQMERLGEPGNEFRQMGFSIEKAVVEARGRALKAQYSLELAQDLRAVHGLDAEAELANILSSEILSEINREIVRTVYRTALPGAQNNVNTAGTFDLDVDSNGRWSVEKFKGLLFQIERDCNAIAQLTRRGKGNMIICSADVASALTMAGVLDYTPALNANLNVDDTGNLFAGTINGKLKVYIDPYSANVSDTHYYVVGYKGSSAYDAGLFYCPYIPLQMVRSVTSQTFQPNIGFKTRYGLIANPYAEGPSGPYNQGLGRLTDNSNRYYRRVKIENLM
jgi:hypothetical protein